MNNKADQRLDSLECTSEWPHRCCLFARSLACLLTCLPAYLLTCLFTCPLARNQSAILRHKAPHCGAHLLDPIYFYRFPRAAWGSLKRALCCAPLPSAQIDTPPTRLDRFQCDARLLVQNVTGKLYLLNLLCNDLAAQPARSCLCATRNLLVFCPSKTTIPRNSRTFVPTDNDKPHKLSRFLEPSLSCLVNELRASYAASSADKLSAEKRVRQRAGWRNRRPNTHSTQFASKLKLMLSDATIAPLAIRDCDRRRSRKALLSSVHYEAIVGSHETCSA